MGTQRPASEHDTKILSILREQRTKGLFTDVKIVSVNAVFWAHACILAPFSLLVSKIFYSQNCEGDEEKWSTQSPYILKFPSLCDSLADVDNCNRSFCDECIQKVIDFIYNGQITVDDSHAEHVQFIVRFLGIENFPLKRESGSKGTVFHEDEGSNFELKVGSETKNSESSKTNSLQFSGLPGGKKTEIKSRPKQARRTDFENILSETNSVVSEKGLFPAYANGSNNHRKNPSFSREKLMCTDTHERVDCNYVPESSDKKKRPSTDVEIGAELENTAVKKGRLLKNGELNPSNYICLFCPFEGSSILDLLNHKLKHDHEKDTICFLCCNDFSSNRELQLHLKEHLDHDAFTCDQSEVGGKSYKCDQCCKVFRWRQSFQRHLSTHDAPHKKCPSCDFVAKTNYVLKYHIKKMHSDSFYSCYHENCTFKTKRKGNLKDHMLSVHKKTILCCPNCDKTFSLKKNLQRHLNLYHNTSTTIHHCSMCTYVTHRADNLQKHKISMHNNVTSNTYTEEDNKIITEKSENNSNNPININIISLENNEGKGTSGFTQKSLETDNLYQRDFYTNTVNKNNSNFSAPMVNVTCSDFSITSSTFSARSQGQGQIANLCRNGFTENSSSFSVLHTENERQTVDDQVPQIISLPHIDCKMTGTLSFNETAGTLTYHNLNSESTGALILNETTGELTYIKLVPQQSTVPNLQHEPNYGSFSHVDYSDLPCAMNYSPLTTNDTNTLILNESTGELDSINATKEQDTFEWNDRLPGRSEDDCALLFDAVDEEEEENDLLDIDPTDFMNESNSNSEIPVLNEWTGEINLLPNNFIGGPFLDEQTGQLSVFDLFDNDLIFDCLEEPPLPNTILNENTGEMLSNNINEDNYPSNIGNDYRLKETFGETNGDCPLLCDDITLDSDLEYSLNEATGQLSIEWPEVSEDSNFSFLLNELTGELSVKEINGQLNESYSQQ